MKPLAISARAQAEEVPMVEAPRRQLVHEVSHLLIMQVLTKVPKSPIALTASEGVI